MQMFYAESATDPLNERGVFTSIEEFAPYRAIGWSGTPENNALADAYLSELAAQELRTEV